MKQRKKKKKGEEKGCKKEAGKYVRQSATFPFS